MKSFNFFGTMAVIVILAIAVLIGSGLSVCSASAEQTVAVATLEYHPWTGKNLKFNGFVNHVISEAFQRQGYTARYTYLPWKRAVLETRNGNYAALSYVYFSEDREKEFYLSDTISEEKIVFFHLKSNPIIDWKSLDDLRNYKFGATRGYTYTQEFWRAAQSKRLNVDVTDSDIQNFKKLFAGRIDIFPSGLVNGYNFLKKEFDPGKSHIVTYHPKPLSETTGHLAFTMSRENSENLLRIFNQGLAELKKDGLYDLFRKNLLEGTYNP